MLRAQLGLITILVLSGCAWSYSFKFEQPNVESIEHLPIEAVSADISMVLKRCFGDLTPVDREATVQIISRGEARALREFLQKIEAGDVPTEAEYAAAGCEELDSN